MEVELLAQLRLAGCSVLLGVFLGVCWDVVRLFRQVWGVPYSGSSKRYGGVRLPLLGDRVCIGYRARKDSALLLVVLAMGDILFAAVAAMAVRLLLFVLAEGELRFFALFGAAAGFAAYYYTVGRLFLAVSGALVFALRVALAYLVFFLLYPCKKGAALCMRLHIRQRQRRYHKRALRQFYAAAKAGFLPAVDFPGNRM